MGQGGDDSSRIAVVGLAGRFPGARDVAAFWKNLCAGVESITRFTDAQLLAAGESPSLIADPSYVKGCPALEDIELFDAGFFGWSPLDASVTDPQHRIFLETAWQTLENAGYDPSRYGRPIGVFAGSGMPAYMMYHLITNAELVEEMGEWLIRHTGNDMNFLATRASYEFDLRGPSVNVQTACSSALVAIHMAVQSLLVGECDMALAGASTIVLPQDRGYLAREGEILSRDGHCRPFDEGATGTLFGGGAGCVLLKRLSDAVADGDRVHAVIRGSAINNDGAGKVGFLAPSVGGQARVISEALAVAGVAAEQVGFVEAHGTGTIIGDPIEVTALTQAYRESTEKRGFCRLGSVKANIGHLGEAAGIAAFIKAVLALSNRQIPPHINYSKPNPDLDLAQSPFVINTALEPFAASPRIAGVTALGAGGTNAHVLVEEAPPTPTAAPAAHRPAELLLLSAKTPGALDAATVNLADHLAGAAPAEPADAAYTLAIGRKAFTHRRAVVGSDTKELAAALRERAPARVFTQGPVRAAPPVVFMFAGGGAQYPGMGADLYQHEARFRAVIDQGVAHMKATAGIDLLPLLYPAAADLAAARERLIAPTAALPTLFVTQYALASLLLAWGIRPDAMIGHSMGEYVAACLAGVLTYEQALGLVYVRGQLFETVPPGGMLSIQIAEADVRRLLEESRAWSGLSIAAVNAPELCVVSGANESIAALEKALTEREIDSVRIHIAVPAHSEMLAPILPAFEKHCRTIPFRPPQRRYVSNLTGDWITAPEATNPRYWVDHLRHTVKFSSGLTTLAADPARLLLEVGPGRTLTSLARAQFGAAARAVSTLPHPGEPESATGFLFGAIGRMWTHGVDVDWPAFYENQHRRRVPLPTYPFERKRHWIERPQATVAQTSATGAKPAMPSRDIPRGTEPWRLERTSDTAEQRTFTADFSRERHWLVGEHVIRGGDALLPGTGFLEIIRSALEAGPPCPEGRAVELRDVVCLSPFVVKAGEPRTLRLTVDKRDGQIAIDSGSGGEADLHVTALGAVVDAAPPARVDVAAIRDRCRTPGKTRNGFLEQSFMDFGPRWANVARVGHGEAEALVDLALPDAFAGDLASFPFHPALLDMATGGAQALIPGFVAERDFFVPFSYGRVLIRRPLPARLSSHIRYRKGPGDDTAIFDLTLLDGHGDELASITDFVMKRGRGAFNVRSGTTVDTALERRPDLGDWFYRVGWRQSPLPGSRTDGDAGAPVLLFCDRGGLGAGLGATLAARGRPVVRVRAGAAFARASGDEFVVNPRNAEDFQSLLRALAEDKRTPSAIVHLWSADDDGDARDPKALSQAQDLGFFSLVHLAQAIGTEDVTGPIGLTVIATGCAQIAGESVSPARSTVLGPVRVIPREFPDVACRLVDVRRPSPGSFQEEHLLHMLADEVGAAPGPDAVIAYRGSDRWVQTFEPHRLARPAAAAPRRLRKGGVYLITGGLGGLGLAVAEHLARDLKAKLVLMGRRALPAPGEWSAWLAAHDAADPVSRGIRKVRELEALGAEVSVVGADVTLPADVKRVVDETLRRFGALHGVFHTAGVLDDGVIALKTRASAEAVLAPKVAGTLALDAALAGQKLDCLVLFSSISALCGLAGQVDYAAANAFLDAYAQERLSRDGSFTLSVNWSGWREVGMAAELARQLGVAAGHAHQALATNLLEVTVRDGILPAEGTDALERLLATGALPQMVVSPVDLPELFARLSAPPAPPQPAAAPPAKAPGRDLSKLEAALAEHEAVAEAAAFELDERPGEKRIVAYVVYRPGESSTVSELRRFVRGKVSDDLIPQTFVDVDSLPRNGAGVDQAALPNPFGTSNEVAAPTTPAERLIADLWGSLLGVKQFGLQDNFFDVGGHSLLSARFITRVHKQTGVRLAHADVVTSTLQQLAAKCTAAGGAAPGLKP